MKRQFTSCKNNIYTVNLESQKKKKNSKNSKMFNQICINEEILPIYIYICVVDNACGGSFQTIHINAHNTEYMCYNQTGDISTLDGTSLKLVDKFTYLGSSVSSTEKDIDTRLTKAWIAIDRLSIIWKSDLTDKMKHSFFQAAVVSILLYGCTTWTLTKHM